MARRRKAGDDVYNARRRYARQAERYEKKARQASGIEASRYQQLARTSLEKAVALYDDPAKAGKSSLINRLTKTLNPRTRSKKLSDSTKNRLMRESDYATAGAFKDDESRREEEARILLQGEAGQRLYAALSEVWGGVDYSLRDYAIMEQFGVDSMADVLDAIAAVGIDLYADDEPLYSYHEIASAIALAFA